MSEDTTRLIEEAVAKALAGDMDMINAIEDRVTRSKAKAALVKAKRAAKTGVKGNDKPASQPAEAKKDLTEKTLNQKVAEFIKSQFPSALDGDGGEGYIQLRGENWTKIARSLKDSPDFLFDSLECITGVDLEKDGLEVRYNFHSMTLNHSIEIRIKTTTDNPTIPSIEKVWRIGDWFERETYDMYGIIFEGHENLKRILLPGDWEGWPLRRNYETQETYHGIPVPKMKEGWE